MCYRLCAGPDKFWLAVCFLIATFFKYLVLFPSEMNTHEVGNGACNLLDTATQESIKSEKEDFSQAYLSINQFTSPHRERETVRRP